MITVRNNLLPLKGFAAMNFCGIILFVRKEVVLTERVMNHERIHTRQIIEMMILFFYLVYSIEWAIKLFKHGLNSYYHLSFEREAYTHEVEFDYLKKRKMFSWIKYL